MENIPELETWFANKQCGSIKKKNGKKMYIVILIISELLLLSITGQKAVTGQLLI
ncbi:MAG: hypothetical protein ACFFD4_32190 [Candidatus Odinarchaeota archaeon]